MPKTIHFEELWDKSEKAAVASNLTDRREIIGKLSSTLDEIRDIYNIAGDSKHKQLMKEMKSKAIGRLLFNITALSAKENIDVYAALKDQLDISEFKEKVIF